jgi:MFS superfamily sulfate permease-like transporter
MISRIDAFLKERSSLPITTACLFLILVLAAMDHTTGYELSFSIFYLLPIAFTTWYAGLYHGVLLSIVSASVWLIVDMTAGTLHRISAFSNHPEGYKEMLEYQGE